ncbi:Co-chaperone protein DjlA [bacterium HR40]|nr:Co-chaperone protein DjlA [bacterium HR40]
MSIWGKLAGAAAGFVLGGPLGALLGGLAGHVFDHVREKGEGRKDMEPELDQRELRRLAFGAGVVALAAKLAKVDGVVSRDEVEAFREVFRIDDEEVPQVAKLFDEARESPFGFEAYATQVAEVLGHDPALLEELLDALIAIAAADGRLHRAEEQYLREVARLLGFGPWQFEQILARWQATFRREAPAEEEPDPYAVLGVSRDASDEEIRRTWRRLVREHHPDRLVAEGLPEELVRRANERLAAINAAYDRIAKQRGFT